MNGRCVDDKGHRGRGQRGGGRGGINEIADDRRPGGHGGCRNDKDCDFPKKCQGGVCRVVNDDCRNCKPHEKCVYGKCIHDDNSGCRSDRDCRDY